MPSLSKVASLLILQNSAIFASIKLVDRRAYDIEPININGRTISKVVIDEHVQKHPDVSDTLILKLVAKLDGSRLLPEDTKAPFEYYVNLIVLEEKQYRIVWLLEEKQIYIGIITVYRDERSR